MTAILARLTPSSAIETGSGTTPITLNTECVSGNRSAAGARDRSIFAPARMACSPGAFFQVVEF
jgi:hypothetical protein